MSYIAPLNYFIRGDIYPDIGGIVLIKNLLQKKDERNEFLIDIVLVVVDAGSKDMGTTFNLINKVIIPNMHDKKRIIVAINQVDQAIKNSEEWDYGQNCPKPALEDYLKVQANSIKKRIMDSTGVNICPFHFSALQKYKIPELLLWILQNTPEIKRLTLLTSTKEENRSPEGWAELVLPSLKLFGKSFLISFFTTLSAIAAQEASKNFTQKYQK